MLLLSFLNFYIISSVKVVVNSLVWENVQDVSVFAINHSYLFNPFATLHNEVCFRRPWDQLELLVSSLPSFKLSLIAALSYSGSH